MNGPDVLSTGRAIRQVNKTNVEGLRLPIAIMQLLPGVHRVDHVALEAIVEDPTVRSGKVIEYTVHYQVEDYKSRCDLETAKREASA